MDQATGLLGLDRTSRLGSQQLFLSVLMKTRAVLLGAQEIRLRGGKLSKAISTPVLRLHMEAEKRQRSVLALEKEYLPVPKGPCVELPFLNQLKPPQEEKPW